MNVKDVIDSYVTDVAVLLPRKQRNDVAFELRALIKEGLQDKAEASGRGADEAMATEFLRGFGRPEEVAARYGPTLTIVDPADGRLFLRAAVFGLAILWGLGLAAAMFRPADPGLGVLQTLGRWWGATLPPSLGWLGLLVVNFGTASWVRRRWPQTAEWRPRAGDRIRGGRAAKMLSLVGVVCGIYLLVNPRWLLDFFYGGRAAPAAYTALTYTETFLHRQGPCLLFLLILNIPLFAAVIVKGRWSALLRRIETGLGLVTCAAMLWTVVDGPVFMATASDEMVKGIMLLIVAVVAIVSGIAALRSVRPAPSRPSRA